MKKPTIISYIRFGMRRIFLIIIGVFVLGNCFAKMKYGFYHQKILEIESDFLHGRFKQSLDKYDSLFQLYDNHVFARDCFVAAQIAVFSKDSHRVEKFLSIGFLNGLTLEMTNSSILLKSYLRINKIARARLEVEFKKKHQLFLTRINVPLRKKLIAIIKNDLAFRKLAYRNKSRFDSVYYIGLEANLLEFLEICRLYGWPGEKKCGIPDFKDHYENHNLYLPQFSSFGDIILLHHECGYALAKEYLAEALKNGEVGPREYALIHDNFFYIQINGFGRLQKGKEFKPKIECEHLEKDCYYSYAFNSFYQMELYDQSTIDKINVDRAKISLPSIEHVKALKQFAKDINGTFSFGLHRMF